MRPPINSTLVITQLFGGNPKWEQYINQYGYTTLGHDGIDIAAVIGTPVYPAWDGKLKIISQSTGFGLHALITDSRGRVALYGHLSEVFGNDGDTVRAHTPFGKSGSTGNSTGGHVHFGIQESPLVANNGYGGFRDPLGGFDPDVVSHLSLVNTNYFG